MPINSLERVAGTPLAEQPPYGDKLLTTGNPDTQADLDLLHRLDMQQASAAV